MQLVKLPRLLIFDLDGTLAHTMPQLAVAVRGVCRELNYREPSFDEVAEYIGNGIPLLIARSLTLNADAKIEDVPEEVRLKARSIFDRLYLAGLKENFELYPGVEDFLKLAKGLGIKNAVLTNKAQLFAKPLIGFMGLEPYFDFILGGEILKERKPDPAPVRYVMEKLGALPSETMMVGDSVNDFEAGRNAGTFVAAFTFGYNRGRDVRDSHPDYVFDSYQEFASLLKSLPAN